MGAALELEERPVGVLDERRVLEYRRSAHALDVAVNHHGAAVDQALGKHVVGLHVKQEAVVTG
jgi:hypothetical protein